MSTAPNKKALNETEICQNYITPAIAQAGWDRHTQIRREYSFTAGWVTVRGKVAVRGKRKRADYLLFYQSSLPLAVVEAKGNNHPVGGGMQQAIAYAETEATAGTGERFRLRHGQMSHCWRTSGAVGRLSPGSGRPTPLVPS